jgi:hypothetical protein
MEIRNEYLKSIRFQSQAWRKSTLGKSEAGLVSGARIRKPGNDIVMVNLEK